MGKGKKTVEVVEEDVPLTKDAKKAAEKQKYPEINGTARDDIVKLLNRVEKAPRVRANFEKIISMAKSKRDSLEKEDPQLDKLITSLEEYIDSRDPRKAADFHNYDIKFLDLYSFA